jgi:hypothetical protein
VLLEEVKNDLWRNKAQKNVYEDDVSTRAFT